MGPISVLCFKDGLDKNKKTSLGLAVVRSRGRRQVVVVDELAALLGPPDEYPLPAWITHFILTVLYALRSWYQCIPCSEFNTG